MPTRALPPSDISSPILTAFNNKLSLRLPPPPPNIYLFLYYSCLLLGRSEEILWESVLHFPDGGSGDPTQDVGFVCSIFTCRAAISSASSLSFSTSWL